MNKINDSWESGDPYEYFMGRWSRFVAKEFLKWVSPLENLKWLDVGCGSGALSEEVLLQYSPQELTAVDQSEGFVQTLSQRLGNRINCKVGDALSLPVDDSSVDVVISGLVLNFIPNQIKALSEMKRVTKPGGTVAVYIWDYPGKMEFLNYFWDCAVELDSQALKFHEGHRFPDATLEKLSESFELSGFKNLVPSPIVIETHFKSFDDYWNPFLGGQGPAPTYLKMLSEQNRNTLKELLITKLPIQAGGSIPLQARAWAVKGKVTL